MKTIKEIAEMVGVSKTAVYALIKAHNIPTHKENNVTHVDENGLALILAHYANAQHDTVKDIIQDSINVDSTVENSHIIGILEKQLDEKQEVIRGLLQALDNSQRLQAVPLLSPPVESPPPKKSFWDKFKKK